MENNQDLNNVSASILAMQSNTNNLVESLKSITNSNKKSMSKDDLNKANKMLDDLKSQLDDKVKEYKENISKG